MAASTLKAPVHDLQAGHMSRLVFCASFLVLLPVVLVAQLLTLRWRTWLPGAEESRSLIGGLKSAVYTFMSSIP